MLVLNLFLASYVIPGRPGVRPSPLPLDEMQSVYVFMMSEGPRVSPQFKNHNHFQLEKSAKSTQSAY